MLNKLHPTHITALAALTGLLVPLFLYLHMPYPALLALAFSGLCDILDGAFARKYNKTSPLGAAFDITSDRLVEFATVLGLFLFDPTRALPCLLMLGSILLCVTTFLIVGVFSENDSEKSFHYSPGIMERREAFAFFALMILLPSFFTLLAITFTVLVTLTAFTRLCQFRNNTLRSSCESTAE